MPPKRYPTRRSTRSTPSGDNPQGAGEDTSVEEQILEEGDDETLDSEECKVTPLEEKALLEEGDETEKSGEGSTPLGDNPQGVSPLEEDQLLEEGDRTAKSEEGTVPSDKEALDISPPKEKELLEEPVKAEESSSPLDKNVQGVEPSEKKETEEIVPKVESQEGSVPLHVTPLEEGKISEVSTETVKSGETSAPLVTETALIVKVKEEPNAENTNEKADDAKIDNNPKINASPSLAKPSSDSLQKKDTPAPSVTKTTTNNKVSLSKSESKPVAFTSSAPKPNASNVKLPAKTAGSKKNVTPLTVSQKIGIAKEYCLIHGLKWTTFNKMAWLMKKLNSIGYFDKGGAAGPSQVVKKVVPKKENNISQLAPSREGQTTNGAAMGKQEGPEQTFSKNQKNKMALNYAASRKVFIKNLGRRGIERLISELEKNGFYKKVFKETRRTGLPWHQVINTVSARNFGRKTFLDTQESHEVEGTPRIMPLMESNTVGTGGPSRQSVDSNGEFVDLIGPLQQLLKHQQSQLKMSLVNLAKSKTTIPSLKRNFAADGSRSWGASTSMTKLEGGRAAQLPAPGPIKANIIPNRDIRVNRPREDLRNHVTELSRRGEVLNSWSGRDGRMSGGHRKFESRRASSPSDDEDGDAYDPHSNRQIELNLARRNTNEQGGPRRLSNPQSSESSKNVRNRLLPREELGRPSPFDARRLGNIVAEPRSQSGSLKPLMSRNLTYKPDVSNSRKDDDWRFKRGALPQRAEKNFEPSRFFGNPSSASEAFVPTPRAHSPIRFRASSPNRFPDPPSIKRFRAPSPPRRFRSPSPKRMMVMERPPTITPGKPCKVAVVPIDYPDGLLASKEIEMIRNALLTSMGTSNGPRFNGTFEERGAVIFDCEDCYTVSWLWEMAPNLRPWPGARLKATSWDDNRPEVAVEVPSSMSDMPGSVLCQKLMAQNPLLNTNDWQLKHFDYAGHNTKMAVFSVDDNSLKTLVASNFTVYLGFSKVSCRLLKDSGRH